MGGSERGAGALKPIVWVGSSRRDIASFPLEVRRECGFALYLAQIGLKAEVAKPLRGFGGAHVLEVVLSDDGKAFRAVYTVAFSDRIYVLHAFQKKSKSGIATPQPDVELIEKRLKAVLARHGASGRK